MDGGWWVGRDAGSGEHRRREKGEAGSWREKNGQGTGQWKRLASIWAREALSRSSNRGQPGFCRGGQLGGDKNDKEVGKGRGIGKSLLALHGWADCPAMSFVFVC